MPQEEFGSLDAPPGTIAMWPEPLSEIPSGWVLCDGNNGTPNLLDRYGRSVGSAEDPGATGGQNSYTLSTSQMPDHGHNDDVATAGGHSHQYVMSKYTFSGSGGDGPYNDGPTTTATGSHSHTTNLTATGNGDSVDNRPDSYEVAFIQKA